MVEADFREDNSDSSEDNSKNDTSLNRHFGQNNENSGNDDQQLLIADNHSGFFRQQGSGRGGQGDFDGLVGLNPDSQEVVCYIS